jgi:hypothetical protein
LPRFAPEWQAVAGLALLVAFWAPRIGLTFTATASDGLLPLVALTLLAILGWLGWRRGQLVAEYLVLTLAASTAICALSYLCLASSGGLADARLMAMDRALGFDWIAGYRFVAAHPGLKTVLGLAYQSLIYQGLYFCVLLGLMNRRDRLREMFWLFFLCGTIACLGTWALPAMGPSKFFNIDTAHGFVPVMKHLLSRQDMNFALTGMTGVVSFPSFHTSMALAYPYAFRGTGPVGRAVIALNLVMLVSVPFFGGHYLVDMIAGAALLLAAVGIVETARKISAGDTWRYTARYAPGAKVSA